MHDCDTNIHICRSAWLCADFMCESEKSKEERASNRLLVSSSSKKDSDASLRYTNLYNTE